MVAVEKGALVGVETGALVGYDVPCIVVGPVMDTTGALDTVGAAETVGVLVGGAVTVAVGAGETCGSSHVFTHRRQSFVNGDTRNCVAVRKVSPIPAQLSAATAQCSNVVPSLDTQAPTSVLSQLHSGPEKMLL